MGNNIDDIFPSNYLKASDIAGEPVVTIKRVFKEEVNAKMLNKLIAEFNELQKPMVVNKTNAYKLAELLGNKDYTTWTGKQVRIYTPIVPFQGKENPAIRFKSV